MSPTNDEPINIIDAEDGGYGAYNLCFEEWKDIHSERCRGEVINYTSSLASVRG